MRQIITFLLLLALSAPCLHGQDFREKFNSLISKKDTVAAEKLLAEWNAAQPGNAELYIAYYNFYARKSRTEIVVLGNDPKEGPVLQLMDKDTNVKKPAGYMYSEVYYKPEILNTGFAYIDTGIAKNPNRLDMRFGKIYMLGESKDYERFTQEIIKTIDYSAVVKNKWLWTDNEASKEREKAFFLSGIHDYVLTLYNTGDDGLLDNMTRISQAVLKHYPNHVESLTNLSIPCMLKEDYDGALKALLKAANIAPQDYIVLSNIAYCYLQKKDTKNAIKYYELTAKHGDDSAKEMANKKIAELKKK